MKLYLLTQEYEEILDELYDKNGVINEKALLRLENNQADVEEKSIAIASFIKNIEAEYIAIEKAKRAMLERQKKHKKKIEDLKAYLLSNMERMGINKITCPHFEIKLKKCPPSVNVMDEDILPEEYKRTKTEVTIDKEKILQEIKEGVIIPGVSMKQNLRIEIK